MKSWFASLRDLWSQLGINQRVTVVVAALVVVAGLGAVAHWSRQPDYQLLYGRLGEADTAAVVSMLQQQNVPYRLEQGGSAVFVPADRVHRLRMDLAAKGVPAGGGVGFEIFDRGDFGISDFVQRTNLTRAIQGELARTIAQLQGVRAARVLVVQPESRLLLTDSGARPSASVFVDLGGGRLPLEAVNAIRQLVSNAVQGLTPDRVAVVDNRGRTLSAELQEDPLLTGATSQMRHRQAVEDYLTRKVETMLAAAVGPGNAVVRVAAEIDASSVSTEEQRFDPEGQVIRTQTSDEDSSTSTEERPGGAVGTAANVEPQPTGGPQVRSEQTRKNRTTSYEINSTRTSTVRPPGTVREITASVLLNQAAGGTPRSPAEIESLRQIVLNALGVRPTADRPATAIVAIQEVAFSLENGGATATGAPAVLPWWETVASQATRAAPVLIAAVALLLFWRMFRREKPAALPVELLEALPEVRRPAASTEAVVSPEAINNLIRQKPEVVGTALRDWVAATKTE